ncbi:MAG: helix-turn-helix transcriptional regulator [Ruminococcaceae bacterium]|nr:helix-turn-helix transcriptional regulator [Oscillospiraceae bacterium]
MEAKIKIGEKIRLLRKKNDVTQDKLADYLGVTPQAVSRWESGVCYPDMNALPSIADYFSVSMDELLCYTGAQKATKVKEYLAEVEHLLDRDKVTDALELLRRAMAEIPSDHSLQLEAAGVLSLYAGMLTESGSSERVEAAVNAVLSEAVSLCRHILEDCTDDGLRDETKKTLCDIYAHQLGDLAQAEEIADQLHGMSVCREIIRATMLTGDIAFGQAQQNLILFADNIWWHLYNLACVPDIAGDRYSTAEKISILRKGISLFTVIFDDEPLFYADRLANSYRQLAMLYLASGYTPEALECFEKMADWAIRYDERPDTATYSSVIINHVAYNKEDDTEAKGISKCARLLRGNFAARIWSPIRSNDRFKAAVARMIDCAQAHAEDEE